MKKQLVLVGHARQRRTRLGLLVATVVKTLATSPSQATELDVHQTVLDDLLRHRVNHHDTAPVASALRNLVGRARTVRAERQTAKRRCSIGTEGVRIQKHLGLALGLAVQQGLAVQHRLALKPVVPVEVLKFALDERSATLLVVPQFGEAIAQRLAVRNPLQVALRHLVLCLYPCVRFFTPIIFQPPVGVCDVHAKIGFHVCGIKARHRVCHRLFRCLARSEACSGNCRERPMFHSARFVSRVP